MRFAVMQALYLVVFGVLKRYWFLFPRAINFISRRQEFRADELACMVAGPESLISGLRMGHGANLAWPSYWNTEVAPMLNSGFLPSISGGFVQFLAAPFVSKQVEKGIDTEIREGKLQAYDSHPPLRDRIVRARTMPDQPVADNLEPAWSLLEDEGATELALLQILNPGMPKECPGNNRQQRS